MAITASKMAAISRLFSSTVFRELATKGRSSLFARLLRESFQSDFYRNLACVGDAFDAAFEVLRYGRCRDEYIYKAALTHRVLLGTHSLRTACMMNEFRVGDCKADMVILNGTATVYEIKSERDSLTRLERQIEAYKRVFPTVVVITGENHLESVLSITSPDVGVMRLSNRYQISTVREAVPIPERISSLAVLDAIRIDEAKEILQHLGISIPTVPNTLMRSVLRAEFAKLNPVEVHIEMTRTLKRSRNLVPLTRLIEQLPSSLHAAALSVPVRKSDHDRLVGAVNTRLREALAWG